MGGKAPADRSRVGICRTRRTRAGDLRLGRRLRAERKEDAEFLEHGAPAFPGGEPEGRRRDRHLAGRDFSGERLRSVRHDRQRLAVGGGLVSLGLFQDALLQQARRESRRPWRELRPGGPRRAGRRAQARHARRLVPVQRRLLPFLPPERAARHRSVQPDVASRLQAGDDTAGMGKQQTQIIERGESMKRYFLATLLVLFAAGAHAQAKKPNILVIWGDDIGQFNVSAYNLGMMGYRTPNIDRIAKEGALFTDWYGQQSCTAGRAAFITGQSPIRTGLTKVGLPGAPEGLKKEDPTIADFLKAQGYATGQFGKNHLGDRNENFPTVHGFDEFFGNFYHLNAEEEPENVDYPKNPKFKEMFGPRGVYHCFAADKDDTAVEPRFGKIGKQKCEDTGPLNRKRMETVDEEITAGALKFMDKANKDGKPFFVWWNSTRMHIFTHLKPASVGKTGLAIEADGMVEDDGMVG